MKRVNSPEGISITPVLTVGFCTDKDQESRLLASGVPADRIYMLGRGLENLSWAISWLRQRGGILKIATDLRIIGATRRTLMLGLKALEMAKVKIVDVSRAGAGLSELIHAALLCISNARFIGDRRKARRVGAKGGEAKGVSAWIARNEIAPRWLIENMVAMFGAVKTATALNNKISASTLRRKYVTQPST